MDPIILAGWQRFRSRYLPATSHDLERLTKAIMNTSAAIKDFAQKQGAFNTRLETAIGGVSDDVTELKSLIEQLQNSPGEISAEDQALLDELQSKADALVTKAESLDALTPPKVPTVPGDTVPTDPTATPSNGTATSNPDGSPLPADVSDPSNPPPAPGNANVS